LLRQASPPRATSLGAQLGRDKRGIRHEPRTVITATSSRITADEIAKTLILRAQISFQLAAGHNRIPAPHTLASIGTSAALVFQLLSIIISRIPIAGAGRIPKRQQIARGKNS